MKQSPRNEEIASGKEQERLRNDTRKKEKRMNYTFIALVENKPGVLNRVASLFRRRNFNIESLAVGRTENPEVSRMTVVVGCPNGDIDAQRIESNLYKLVNVIDVQDVTHQPSVSRDLALIKVKIGPEKRAEVNSLAEIFRAHIVDVAVDAVIVEITGTEDKIEGMIELLRPLGIVEMVRTGQVSMTRGVNDGVRRMPGVNGNRYEDVSELAEMAP
jgi:acetolactate synthase-1/3 small subunit